MQRIRSLPDPDNPDDTQHHTDDSPSPHGQLQSGGRSDHSIDGSLRESPNRHTAHLSRARSLTAPGTRAANLGEYLWAFVHPALYGDGKRAAQMLGAAVDEYGYRGAGLVEAMLATIRSWAREDPDPGEWAINEFEYMARKAPLFEASLQTSPL